MKRLRDAWLVLTGKRTAIQTYDLDVVARDLGIDLDPDDFSAAFADLSRARSGADGWQYNGRDDDGTTHYVHPNGGHIACSGGTSLSMNGA